MEGTGGWINGLVDCWINGGGADFRNYDFKKELIYELMIYDLGGGGLRNGNT